MSIQDQGEGTVAGRGARLLPKVLLALGTGLIALILAEGTFRFAGLPRIPKPHTESGRFVFGKIGESGESFYVNQPGRITFRYDGNPRGYFDERDEVHHDVNPMGFRGPAFTAKPPDLFRIVFLGDSFTFGEGVRNEDIYPEVTARILRKGGRSIDACNLGVGGYNTSQSLRAMQLFGSDLQPDAVVLGYTLNDAEPPLFEIDKATGQPVRRPREMFIEAEAAPKTPPTAGIYRLRLAQAVWKAQHQRDLTQQTIAYYRSVNAPSGEGFLESERALREIISQCQERGIPCIVVMFPLLFDLSDDYPFTAIHQRVGKVVEDAGGRFIDLLPALKGQDARSLIVHPTDQHPNEKAHAIVGRLLSEEISRIPDSTFRR